MSMRIATFALGDRMLAASLRTQAGMGEAQLQQASGAVSTDYGGLGAQARTLVDLEVSVARSKSYSAATQEASSRVEVMYDALSSITDILSEFRASLTNVLGTSASVTTETLSQEAKGYLDDITALLNTQFEGRYLFAGSATTDKPVDLATYAPTDIATADASYYRGNDRTAVVRVSEQRTIDYGVTAGDESFEQALRALALVANATTTLDTATLQEVSALTVTAIDGVTAAQSGLSLDAAALERAATAEADYQDMAATLTSDVNGADITVLAVEISAYEAQLQASYSAISKIQSLSLVDYV